MSSGDRSCLVEKLSTFIDLANVGAELLADLEKDTMEFEKNQKFWSIYN
ncbi:MAG: hypothetical protein ACJAYF_004087 [Arenicella sp.]|jgi:hypothetical protein